MMSYEERFVDDVKRLFAERTEEIRRSFIERLDDIIEILGESESAAARTAFGQLRGPELDAYIENLRKKDYHSRIAEGFQKREEPKSTSSPKPDLPFLESAIKTLMPKFGYVSDSLIRREYGLNVRQGVVGAALSRYADRLGIVKTKTSKVGDTRFSTGPFEIADAPAIKDKSKPTRLTIDRNYLQTYMNDNGELDPAKLEKELGYSGGDHSISMLASRVWQSERWVKGARENRTVYAKLTPKRRDEYEERILQKSLEKMSFSPEDIDPVFPRLVTDLLTSNADGKTYMEKNGIEVAPDGTYHFKGELILAPPKLRQYRVAGDGSVMGENDIPDPRDYTDRICR